MQLVKLIGEEYRVRETKNGEDVVFFKTKDGIICISPFL
jgi:hypothetical protein